MTEHLNDKRLRTLRSTGLLDSLPERAFDRLSRLAAGALGTPVALVSLVDVDRQFFKSAIGLGEPWATRRQTPLSHSFCQYVTRDRRPLVVADAREHPVLRENLAVRDLDVVAYAGVPIIVEDEAIGAFCAVDVKPHVWTAADVQLLADLAESIVSEIELRMALRDAQEQRALTHALLESMGDGVLAMDASGTFLVVNEVARRMFDGAEAGKALPDDWAALHRSIRPDGTPLSSRDGALTRGMRGEATDALEFTLWRSDASEPIWVEASGRPIVDANGKVTAAVAVYRDVTEKKRRVDMYRALAANIPDGAVALFDFDLRCLAVDGGLGDVGGVTRATMVGRTMREIGGYGPEDPAFDPIDAIYRRALAGESATVDHMVGGTTLTLHVGPIRDQVGRITGGIVLALDVSTERRLTAALRQSEQVHRATLQHLPNGAVFMVDTELRFVTAEGPATAEVLRRAEVGELIGRTVGEVVAEANRTETLALYTTALSGERVHREIQRGDRFYDLHAVPIYDAARVSHALVFLYDITQQRRETDEMRRMRDLLAREHTLLEATLANIDEGVALLDSSRRILLANAACGAMFGVASSSLEGLTAEEFFAHISKLVEDPVALREHFERVGSSTSPPANSSASSSTPEPAELVFVRPRRRVLRRAWTPVTLPNGPGFLVTWHDCTAEKDMLAERERMMLIDALTGIANRRAAEASLVLESARSKRSGTALSVAIFDIDHFKRVNDSFGHAMGDEVLRQVAATLVSQARVTDTVARWGGEEFLAVLPGALEGACVFCERARRAVEALCPPRVNRVTVSVGVAQIIAGEPASEAVARADARLYEAKNNGRNLVSS